MLFPGSGPKDKISGEAEIASTAIVLWEVNWISRLGALRNRVQGKLRRVGEPGSEAWTRHNTETNIDQQTDLTAMLARTAEDTEDGEMKLEFELQKAIDSESNVGRREVSIMVMIM